MRVDWSEKIKCVAIYADFDKFDGDAEKWRGSFFELLSWKNTWGIPYELTINAHSDHSPYLYMVVRKEKEDGVLNLLSGYGYGDIRHYDIIAEVFEPDLEDGVDAYYEA